MNRRDFQVLSLMRQREARALLLSHHPAGAYYLIGHAVEAALKACIAKLTKRHDFPDKGFAHQVFTHDLEALMKHARLQPALDAHGVGSPIELNWRIIKDWEVDSRYDVSITEPQARDLYSACVRHKTGVLPWIRRRW